MPSGKTIRAIPSCAQASNLRSVAKPIGDDVNLGWIFNGRHEAGGVKKPQLMVGDMSKLKRLLVAGSTEKPDCYCGAEMTLAGLDINRRSPDAEIRVYGCAACGREFRITVWTESVSPDASAGNPET